ncbi:MAG: MFS transporter [Anaerolineales bacterium]|nr:MFS transporter [Anaerolineales bacterium]
MHFHPNDAHNARLLYREIFFSSILSGIIAFNSAYVLRLGASNADISLLSALPALMAMLVAVPAGQFLQGRARPHRWILTALGIHWTGFLLLGFVPWVQLGWLPAGRLTMLLLVVFGIPAHVWGVGSQAWMAEAVPEQHRMRVFSVRQFINSSVTSVVTFVVGWLLSHTLFPRNYQLLYALGWLSAMVSLAHLARVRVNHRPPPRRPAGRPKEAWRAWRPWPADLLDPAHRDFRRITLNALAHSWGLWMAAPLYILRYVRELDASDAWLGLHATVGGLATIVGLLFWRWAGERLKPDRTFRLTILSAGVFPALVALAPGLTPILLLDVFNGLFAGGINVSYATVLIKALPEDRRTEFYGLYATILNLGAFIAPLLAVALAGVIGIRAVLFICGILALLGSLTHWIWRVPSAAAPPLLLPAAPAVEAPPEPPVPALVAPEGTPVSYPAADPVTEAPPPEPPAA